MSAYSISRIRRSLIYFVLGKGLGVVLGIGLLLTLVRVLDVEAYKFYLISQAVLIIINQLSSFGFEPTAQRYLPELLTRSEGRTLHRLTGRLCGFRFISFVFIAVSLYPFADIFASILSIDGMTSELRLFLIVVVFELFARFLDILFDSFLLQGVSQISMLLRTGIRIVPIAWLSLTTVDGTIDLTTWILIDIVASITGSLWGVINLWYFLRKTARELPGGNIPIEYSRYRSYSIPIYIAGTVMLVSGQDVIKLIAAHILPNIEFASFGFAAAFVYMLNRYLPMNLFVGMIRPLFVAARQRGDYKTRLPMISELVFKLNLFTLLPIIAFISVTSDQVSALLTGGRYPEAANYMIAFLPILLVETLRSITGLTALAMENARAPLVATFLSLIGLVIGVLLSYLIGAYGFCLGLVVSSLIYSIWVIKELSVYKLVIKYEWLSYTKLTIATFATIGILLMFNVVIDIKSPIILIAIAIQALGFYLFFTYISKPFKEIERDTLNSILKRKVFVW